MFRTSRICAGALLAGLIGLAAAQPAAASPLAASQDAARLATATDIERVQYHGPPRRHWGPPPRYHHRHWRGNPWRGRHWGPPPPRSRVVCRTVFTDWGPRRICRPRR